MTKSARIHLKILVLFAVLSPAVCLSQPIPGAGKITFTGNTGVFVMNPAGTGLAQLSGPYDYCPRWSPDGRLIAFYRFGTSWNSSIFIMNADGSNQIEIVHNFTPSENNVIDSCPSWSPYGRELTFSYLSNIYTVTTDGSGLRNLGPGNSPDWSPDGSKIAFENGGIYTMNTSGQNVTKLDRPVSSGCSDYVTPSWSPDGTEIAVGYYCDLVDTGLVILDQNGGLVRRLNIFVDSSSDIVFDGPRWSPDGSQLVFNATTIVNDRLDVPFTDIYRMNGDGSGLTRLTAGASPDWEWQHVLLKSTLRTLFDFDGDGKTDISIFRPVGASGGAEWWYVRSSDGQAHASQFGTSTDQVVAADFTGDGKTDIAVWRPSTGQWFIVRSEDGSFYAFPFGAEGDIPMPADYDGDGKADAAVFRPSSATWFILRSSDGGVTFTSFGAPGDQPVSADYNGDGKADIGVFRPNGASGGAEWWIQRSTLGTLALQFGASTDKAVPGDYTGDGRTDIAFFRPSNGQWFVLRSEDFSYFAFPFGTTGDVPVPGDYDGDGKTDAAVFRPSASTWYVNRSSGGTTIQQFATPTDMPVASAYVR